MHTKRLILLLQIAVGVLAAGYGVMFTMLDDWRSEYGIQEAGLSMIIAVGFFTSFFAQLTIAPYADKGHARKLMALGMASNAVGALIMAFGNTLPAFILGRFIMGIGAGVAIPAIKRIVIVSDPENVGANLGRGVSIEVGGFAIGPVIAALTVDSINLAAPFLLIAVLIAATGLIIGRLKITETAIEDLPVNPFAFEVFDLVSRQKTNAKKVELLKRYEHPSLKSLFIWNFDETIVSVLPEGFVPYASAGEQNAYKGTLSDKIEDAVYKMGELESNSLGSQDQGRTSIRKEYTYFYNFVKEIGRAHV